MITTIDFPQRKLRNFIKDLLSLNGNASWEAQTVTRELVLKMKDINKSELQKEIYNWLGRRVNSDEG